MTVITQINDLIDSHGNYSTCEGCSTCKQIAKLSKELKRPSPEVKFKHILSKGEDMTKKEITQMLKYGLSKKSLRAALKMNSNDFTRMMREWGFLERNEKEEEELKLTAAEYLKFKEEGLTDPDIAKKLGVEMHTIRNWKYRNRIKGRVTTAKQADAEVPKQIESKPTQTDKQVEYRDLINELSNALDTERKSGKEKDSLITKLEEKVRELESSEGSEGVNLKAERDNYLNQLIASRHELVLKDYELENTKKDFENVDKTIRRYARENRALRELISLWI